jgi:putative oxidoreductase
MPILTKSFINLSTGLFLLRLILGIVFFAHGAQKVLGWFGGYGLVGTGTFFQQTWGIPPILFYLSAFTEFLGGIALLLGIFSRIFSLGLIINMLVAILVAHISQGFFGFEWQLTLLTVALTIFLLGPGDYSIDNKLFNRLLPKDVELNSL